MPFCGGRSRWTASWEYALDGRLVEPEPSSRIDPSRFRLTGYPVHLCNGLSLSIFPARPRLPSRTQRSPSWLCRGTVR
jgi:hypothetical protein